MGKETHRSMSSSAYDKVKRGKLSFKGGLDPEKKIDKKKKKKQHKSRNPELEDDEAENGQGDAENKETAELDTGIGHLPDGSKKSKHYEELFPVETKRFSYDTAKTLTREEALDIRVKQKADRYCK